MPPRRCTSGTIPRQLLSDPAGRGERRRSSREDDLFGPDYLIRRPLLRALQHPGPRPAVLLIDEIDRADDDFEAFLLELLGEAAVTIPELGTIRATHPPVDRADVATAPATCTTPSSGAACTSGSTIRAPSARSRSSDGGSSGASETLAVQVADAVVANARLRRPEAAGRSPRRSTGWRRSSVLGVERLDAAAIERTLGSVLKYAEDQEVAPGGRARAVGGRR